MSAGGLSFAGNDLARFAAIKVVEHPAENFERGARDADGQAVNPVSIEDGQFDDAVNDFNCGDFPDEQACNSHPQHSRKPLDPCLPLTVKEIDERLTGAVIAARLAASVPACRHLTVASDLVAQDFQFMGRAPLVIAGGFVDSIIERGNDCRDLGVVDSAPVPQPRHDRPEGKLGGVIHPRVLP